MPLELPRRSFLRGLVAAPAIVAFKNIMPVKVMPDVDALDTLRWVYSFSDVMRSYQQITEIMAANIFNVCFTDKVVVHTEGSHVTYTDWLIDAA